MLTEILIRYRVECVATWEPSSRGCSGTGPRGMTEQEARDLAIESEWEVINNKWCCPAHVQGYFAHVQGYLPENKE